MLAGCAPAGTASPEAPVGFFPGLVHGFLAPLTLVLGLIFDSIKMYEPHNVGGSYNLGFLIAVCAEILIIKTILTNRSKKL